MQTEPILGYGFIAIGMISLIQLMFRHMQARSWRNRPTTEGHVLKHSITRKEEPGPYNTDGPTVYETAILFEYHVEGVRYESRTIDALTIKPFDKHELAIERVVQFPVGSRPQVHYKRSNPRKAVLVIAESRRVAPLLILALILMIAGVVMTGKLNLTALFSS